MGRNIFFRELHRRIQLSIRSIEIKGKAASRSGKRNPVHDNARSNARRTILSVNEATNSDDSAAIENAAEFAFSVLKCIQNLSEGVKRDRKDIFRIQPFAGEKSTVCCCIK